MKRTAEIPAAAAFHIYNSVLVWVSVSPLLHRFTCQLHSKRNASARLVFLGNLLLLLL